MKKRLHNLKVLQCLGSICGLALLAGCFRAPAETPVYQVSRDAVLKAVKQSEKVGDFEDCHLYIGKSAARVDMPVMLSSAGMKRAESYTVLLKRVARTWVVSDVIPTPGTGGRAHRLKPASAVQPQR